MSRIGEIVDRVILHRFFWIGCLVWYFSFAAVGFFVPITDHHQFRQAQTAWGARSIAEGVNPLKYEVPVLGPPWSAPFEFPVYQALTGWGARFTGLDLVFVGRLVGVAFFLLSVFAFHGILARVGFGRRDRRIVTAFFLLCPFYIFWSRAVMMESTALAFAMLAPYFFLRLRDRVTVWNVVGFVLSCVLAAVVKATTFFAFALFVALWMMHLVARERRISAACWAAFVGLALSVVAEMIWSRYSEALRLKGTLTDLWLHENVMTFVTGDWPMKWRAETWARFVERGRLAVGHKLFFVPVLFLPWMKRDLRGLVYAGLFFVFVPFLAFTNVHVKHDYYAYAHGFGFIMAYGALLIHLLDSPRWRTWGAVVVACSFFLQFRSYITKESLHYKEGIVEHQAEIDYIRGNTKPDDVVLISGLSWDPTIPFLAERRATMFQFPLHDMENQVRSMLGQLKREGYSTPLWMFCDLDKTDVGLAKKFLSEEPRTVWETQNCTFLRL